MITLTGTNFVSGATVRVGGAAATSVTFVSATQVRATTPAGTAGARDVQITNPGGQSATRTSAFTYTSSTAPTITAVSPASGPTSGGTVITITGSNYVLGAGGEIRVGGVMCSNIQYISATQLRATTPSGTAGARDVYIRNPNGQTVTRTGGFTYTTTSSLTQAQSSSESLSADGNARAPSAMDANMVDAAAADQGPVEARALATSTTAGGSFRRYLAEGIETDQMKTRLAIANAGPADAHVRLTFEQADGATTQIAVDVPARARRTVSIAEHVPALVGASFSTLLESDQPVALDRLISLDAHGVGASLETAVDQASVRAGTSPKGRPSIRSSCSTSSRIRARRRRASRSAICCPTAPPRSRAATPLRPAAAPRSGSIAKDAALAAHRRRRRDHVARWCRRSSSSGAFT